MTPDVHHKKTYVVSVFVEKLDLKLKRFDITVLKLREEI